ncbi:MULTISPECIES: hypothetical protein [Nostocales]|uniref:Uncharacterized protein n=3 Tax=Nostocales TaxID=1161 RepID=A0A0C1QMT4_9CYAN|nr:hypothetical protein [Tolypothrix bouteillei]KAF3889800.1 hypothetical protein DA73_0400033280 [Tolypothrix bouteillei VB521301]
MMLELEDKTSVSAIQGRDAEIVGQSLRVPIALRIEFTDGRRYLRSGDATRTTGNSEYLITIPIVYLSGLSDMMLDIALITLSLFYLLTHRYWSFFRLSKRPLIPERDNSGQSTVSNLSKIHQ